MTAKITNSQIAEIAHRFGIEYAALKAFIEVESGGKGFDQNTGKILIQFEPVWFKRKVPYAPSGAWSVNKVDVQSKEWTAFNSAFAISPNGAMGSTSIGLAQIMGFHWQIMGYKSVGDMWDHAKKGEYEQVEQLCIFLKNYLGGRILRHLKERDWHNVAVYYNGSGYMAIAKQYGREPYNISMEKAYKKYSISQNLKTTSDLNLRKGQSVKYDIIKVLPKGTTVKVVSISGGWSEIEALGLKGWVSNAYIK